MKRTLLVPPILGPEPLAELKHWLAISNTQDDASLEELLRSALETCEAFTGLMPVTASLEEIHPAKKEWAGLFASPVLAITGLEGVANDGSRYAVPASEYEIDISGDSRGCFRLTSPTTNMRVAVQFRAGLAEDWDDLPDGLRHGVLRLAAHSYRSRENDDGPGPPSAVAALWRPWRRMRIA